MVQYISYICGKSNTMRNFLLKCGIVCFIVAFDAPLLADTLRNGLTDDLVWEQAVSQIFQDEDISPADGSVLYDYLYELYENPIDINSASARQLFTFPFISQDQIEEIQAYIYLHGNMKSLGELMLIPGLDYYSRALLSLFVYAGDGVIHSGWPVSFRQFLRQSHSEILTHVDIPLYQRSGFKYHSPSELERYPNRSYLGTALQHNLRFTFNWSDKIKAGFSADKDAGEVFIGGKPLVYDYLSGYIQFSNIRWLENFAAGNIKASFGRGLVLNSGFGMGKGIMLNNLGRQVSGIKPHSSTSETGYLTGAGATVKAVCLSLSALASYTRLDATLKDDTLITSFKEDGYHRTPLEYSKKGNTHETLMAFHAGWRGNGIILGATCLMNRYDKTIRLDEEISPIPVPAGVWFWNAALDYSIRRAAFSFYGETAICDNLSMATINTLCLKISDKYNLMLLYRNYSSRYNAFHGNSMSEGELRNESGLYTGISGNVLGLNASVYIDFFHFPEARYGVSDASKGFDAQVQLEYSPYNGSDNIVFRYRLKDKQQDSKSMNDIADEYTGRMRLQWTHTFSKVITLQSQLSFVHYYSPDKGPRTGFALGEVLSVAAKNGKLSGSISLNGFNTDGYDTSISVYERGLLYSFNFITLYGKGVRGSLMLKYKFTPGIYAILKFGSSVYFDREVISSSQQQIDSSHKEDISLQLRARF